MIIEYPAARAALSSYDLAEEFMDAAYALSR
jgi:hypothetical protein